MLNALPLEHVIPKPSNRAKRLILKVDAALGKFVLTVPPRATQKDIDAFLYKVQPWMEQQNLRDLNKASLMPGDAVTVLGVPRKLVRKDQVGAKSAKILDDEIHIFGPESTFQQQLKKILVSHAEEILYGYCCDAIQKLPRKILGRRYHMTSLTLKDTKSRWGSCSSDGRIMLSWRLVLAPAFVARYVAIHEACHMVEMNHSAKFWALVANQDPSYKDAIKWLKKHGASLHHHIV